MHCTTATVSNAAACSTAASSSLTSLVPTRFVTLLVCRLQCFCPHSSSVSSSDLGLARGHWNARLLSATMIIQLPQRACKLIRSPCMYILPHPIKANSYNTQSVVLQTAILDMQKTLLYIVKCTCLRILVS